MMFAIIGWVCKYSNTVLWSLCFRCSDLLLSSVLVTSHRHCVTQASAHMSLLYVITIQKDNRKQFKKTAVTQYALLSHVMVLGFVIVFFLAISEQISILHEKQKSRKGRERHWKHKRRFALVSSHRDALFERGRLLYRRVTGLSFQLWWRWFCFLYLSFTDLQFTAYFSQWKTLGFPQREVIFFKCTAMQSVY